MIFPDSTDPEPQRSHLSAIHGSPAPLRSSSRSLADSLQRSLPYSRPSKDSGNIEATKNEMATVAYHRCQPELSPAKENDRMVRAITASIMATNNKNQNLVQPLYWSWSFWTTRNKAFNSSL